MGFDFAFLSIAHMPRTIFFGFSFGFLGDEVNLLMALNILDYSVKLRFLMQTKTTDHSPDNAKGSIVASRQNRATSCKETCNNACNLEASNESAVAFLLRSETLKAVYRHSFIG